LKEGKMGSKACAWTVTGAALLAALTVGASGAAGVVSATCNGLTATIVGTAGNDTLVGTAGNDVIAGLAGDDTIDGAGGDDVICGGLGNDGITGGTGVDTVSYAESATAVTVDLGAGTASGEGTDTLAGIENVTGSALADKLTGNASANVLRGAAGADTLDGGPGDDRLDGGAAKDTGSFASSPAGVNANLTTGSATGNGTDTLVAIENLIGSPQADTLTGSAAANVIEGGNGNDTMAGGGGVDTVSFKSATAAVTVDLGAGTASGGAGTDTLTGFVNATGSKKGDTLIGDDSANKLDGGVGTDTCQLKNGVDTGVNCEIVTAALETGGATDTFTFTGAAGKKAFLDDQTTDTTTCSNVQETLTGPGGPVFGPVGICTNHGPITLVKGTYTLTITSTPSTPGTGAYKFRWWDVPPPQSFAYTVGTTVAKDSPLKGEGFIETPQAEDDYTFSGTAGQTIFYTVFDGGPAKNCNFHRTLMSPSNTIVPGTDGFVCSKMGPITLPSSGTYTLRIYPSVNADDVGTYSFRITVVPAAQTFAYTIGTTVSKDSPQPGEGYIELPGGEDDYTFSGTTGQKLFYDALDGGPEKNCNFHRTLMSPSNTIVPGADGFVCSNVGPITLPSTGTYKLRIYPSANADDVGTYSFKITVVPTAQSFAYTIGTTVSKDSPQVGEGFIESPQAEDDYTFSGTAGQKLFYDALDGGPEKNCNFHRTLMSPSNTIVPGADGFVCSNVGPITLPSTGTYKLRIYPSVNADDVGTYSFRFVVVPAAQSFAYTIGTTVSKDSPQVGEGFIESPQAEDDYTFSGTAGQKLFYDYLNGGPSPNCNFHRTLMSPSNTIVPGADGFVCSDVGTITLPSTGTYTLRIYPSVNAEDVGTYSFRIVTVPAAQSFAYTIGTTVSKDSPLPGEGNIETPQAEDDYTFSGTTGQKISYVTLPGGPGANCNFHRTLMSPSNTIVPGGDGFVCQTFTQITLPATGTYTLRIYPSVNFDDVGVYSFKITTP